MCVRPCLLALSSLTTPAELALSSLGPLARRSAKLAAAAEKRKAQRIAIGSCVPPSVARPFPCGQGPRLTRACFPLTAHSRSRRMRPPVPAATVDALAAHDWEDWTADGMV